MPNHDPIVVGVDFTPCSRAALAQAIRIGAATGSAVHAVNVIDTLVVIDLEAAIPEMSARIQDRLIADARGAWLPFVAGVPGVESVTLHVEVNNRIVGILRRVRSTGARLLILGAFGDRKPDVGLGTVASACVRKSPADVLLVRDTQSGPFRRVVACVDFSPTSLRALGAAAQVAAMDKATLHVLHVFQAPWRQLSFRGPVPEITPQFQAQYRESIERRLQSLGMESGRALGLPEPVCEVLDYDGDRSGIVEYARRIGGDLIVLGTRGRTNLRDLMLGSTAEKALRESSCSVLAVKPADFDHPLASESPPTSFPLRPIY